MTQEQVEDLIKSQLGMWNGLAKSSIESYYKTGIVSGTLLIELKELINICITQAISEQPSDAVEATLEMNDEAKFKFHVERAIHRFMYHNLTGESLLEEIMKAFTQNLTDRSHDRDWYIEQLKHEAAKHTQAIADREGKAVNEKLASIFKKYKLFNASGDLVDLYGSDLGSELLGEIELLYTN